MASNINYAYYDCDIRAKKGEHLGSVKMFKDADGSRDGMTQTQAIMFFWNENQAGIMEMDRRHRDAGFEPISEVGPGALEVVNGGVSADNIGSWAMRAFILPQWVLFGIKIRYRIRGTQTQQEVRSENGPLFIVFHPSSIPIEHYLDEEWSKKGQNRAKQRQRPTRGAAPKQAQGWSSATVSLVVAIACFVGVGTPFGYEQLAKYALKPGVNHNPPTLLSVATSDYSLLSTTGGVILGAAAVILILCVFRAFVSAGHYRNANHPFFAFIYGTALLLAVGVIAYMVVAPVYQRISAGLPLF